MTIGGDGIYCTACPKDDKKYANFIIIGHSMCNEHYYKQVELQNENRLQLEHNKRQHVAKLNQEWF